MANTLQEEIDLRRTFAIISHPDAGKTTLTEKLLLYGGAIDLAGSVTAKKKQRETASDWMELEKKRGISISSTVLQFDYNGYHLNLLDTPGHKDFSEDTYRVLMAVDAVIMVIDAGKGIEAQTIKLFEICRKRGIPIFTFMNKLDRPAKSSLELIDQLEKVLNIHAYPVNWPLGSGVDFKGIYDRRKNEVHLFERVTGGAFKAPVSVHDLSDDFVRDLMDERVYNDVAEEIAMLDGAHEGFDVGAVLTGKTTPVFFGSAGNNFGVEFLLKGFVDYSPKPQPRIAAKGEVALDNPHFSGFVFKAQTNMNPMHRDRVVFVRVCSGRFVRDMKAYHTRTGKEIRLADSYNLFGREREVMTDAFPGDIIGFVTKLDLRIGDTISTDQNIIFDVIPRFAPECFGYIDNISAAGYKSFRRGLDHLLAEDIVQAFNVKNSGHPTPLLGAVGPLQFEVLQYRLKDEYGVETRLEMKSWTIMRWCEAPMDDEALGRKLPHQAVVATDDMGRKVVLFPTDWSYKYFRDNNIDVKFFDTPPTLSVKS
jgi:peptide chain release factor 3